MEVRDLALEGIIWPALILAMVLVIVLGLGALNQGFSKKKVNNTRHWLI